MVDILLLPFKLIWKIVSFVVKVGSLTLLGLAIWYMLQVTGLFAVRVPVSGASMLPTFPEKGVVSFKRFSQFENLQPELKRKDVVVFQNSKTAKELQKQHKDGSGFVKRVIGLPGDTVVIQDGYVYVNGEFQAEPYTLKPHSTFGGTEILDCQQITIPEGKIFVLGDNRKISMDSRHLGLISYEDIEYYMPFGDQEKDYSTDWRETKNDKNEVDESTFQIHEYLSLLNKRRALNNLKPLTLEPKLSQSAQLRAQKMLEFDDLSFEATRSGYTMQQSFRDVGYSNVVFGELPITGYYDAQELFDALMEQKKAQDFLMNKEYEEIGISTFVGKLNGCSVQIVVQHLAGYIPPSYDADVVQSWRNALARLREIQPGWKSLQDNGEYYQKNKQAIDRINEIITIRIQRMEAVVGKMTSNQWLSETEKQYTKQDDDLSREQNQIAESLNREE